MQIVTIKAMNHEGREVTRKILPIRIWFGSTDFHLNPQWLLECWDFEKNAKRDFAVAKIREWTQPGIPPLPPLPGPSVHMPEAVKRGLHLIARGDLQMHLITLDAVLYERAHEDMDAARNWMRAL